jgi:hypothetical protein
VLRGASLLVNAALHNRYIRYAFHIIDGILEVGGEYIAGRIMRVIEGAAELYIFMSEGVDRIMINLGSHFELPDGVDIWPQGNICRLANQ